MSTTNTQRNLCLLLLVVGEQPRGVAMGSLQVLGRRGGWQLFMRELAAPGDGCLKASTLLQLS